MADRTRGNYLSVSQLMTLRDWAHTGLWSMFGDDGPAYQVGSSLRRLDWRDVDVRLIMADDRYDALIASGVNLLRLNHAVSVWGQQATGLPVDFQVQRRTEANAEFPTWRSALLWVGVDRPTPDTK